MSIRYIKGGLFAEPSSSDIIVVMDMSTSISGTLLT